MSESPALSGSNKVVTSFDINEGATEKGIRLPSGPLIGPGINGIESYAQYFEKMIEPSDSPVDQALKSLGISGASSPASKSLSVVPSAYSFGRMSYMPGAAVNGGVMQPPGIAPEALRKIVRETIAPQLVIGMRVDDVLRYSEHSDKIWRAGWRIEARKSSTSDDPESENSRKSARKDILDAERFIANSNIETGYDEARKRDQKRYRGFKSFLAALVRDSLTFDGIALWTDMDQQGKVKSYSLLPAGNIRLTLPEGYGGKPDKFAVLVNDSGTVARAFTRDELTYYVRNPRTDLEVYGYGYSEVEIALRLIRGFQNALDLNIDIFDKSSIANGILTISGGTVTQKQLDLLNRLLTNMKRGVTKSWALPVIGLPDGAKLEVIDLSRLKGNEAYYKEFINMLAGALCTLWRFPVRRLGYRISGGHRDAEPMPDDSDVAVDENDPGLSPLLTHIETLINEYLIWSRWPHLVFKFMGKSPKEDARSYEFQSLAKSWGEKRAESGLPPLESLVPSGAPEELKKLAQIMTLCPSDPNMTGAFQTLAAQLLAPKDAGGKDPKSPDSLTQSKKDPAKGESHGHQSGVRRSGEK